MALFDIEAYDVLLCAAVSCAVRDLRGRGERHHSAKRWLTQDWGADVLDYLRLDIKKVMNDNNRFRWHRL